MSLILWPLPALAASASNCAWQVLSSEMNQKAAESTWSARVRVGIWTMRKSKEKMARVRGGDGKTYRLAHSQQTVILQDYCFACSQSFGDPSPFLAIQHHAPEVIVYRVIAPKSQRVLGHHIQFATKDAKGLAVDGVCVAGCIDVGACLVDF